MTQDLLHSLMQKKVCIRQLIDLQAVTFQEPGAADRVQLKTEDLWLVFPTLYSNKKPIKKAKKGEGGPHPDTGDKSTENLQM